MPRFGTGSIKQLTSCHQDLQTIFNEVVVFYDCSILEGLRDRARQEALFEQAKTKVKYPNSKHNQRPSMACDVSPYPVKWEVSAKNIARHYYLAGIVESTAWFLFARGEIRHLIRWGGDWDRDHDFTDQTFDDLVHFELYDPKEN